MVANVDIVLLAEDNLATPLSKVIVKDARTIYKGSSSTQVLLKILLKRSHLVAQGLD